MRCRSVVSSFIRFAILACVALWPCTGFADQQIHADFDGDGQLDHVQMQPAGVVVWLSKARAFSTLRGTGRALRLAVVDLDRDGRPELVALDATKGLRVWKAHKSGKLRPFHKRAPSRGPTLHGSLTLVDNPAGIEAQESTTARDTSLLVLSTRDPVDTRITRPLPPRPSCDPRTSCSRFTTPRAPPTPIF
jgi:hypothetical protein